MAHLLEGTSGHSQTAPLSNAQTLEIARHLQDHIQHCESQCEDLRRCLQETNMALTSLTQGSATSGTAMQQMRDAMATTNQIVEGNCKDLKRANGSIHKLHAGLETATDGLQELRDAQKVTGNTVAKLEMDHEYMTDQMVKIQDVVIHAMKADITHLRDELSKTNLDMKHLSADHAAVKETVRTERDNLRETDQTAKVLCDRFEASETKMRIMEQHLADNSQRVRQTTQTMEDLNLATLKLLEDHEHTKSTAVDLQASLKKAHSNAKQMHDALDRTATGLSTSQNKLEEQALVIDTLRQSLDQAHGRVQHVKEGHERANATIQNLSERVAEVGNTTHILKAGLQEQSALLLPNIQMETAAARTSALAAVSIHGSKGPQPSPRKRRS